MDIRIALARVRDDVLAMTGGRQEPFIYGSLGGSAIALVAPDAVAKKVEPAAAPAPATALAPAAGPSNASSRRPFQSVPAPTPSVLPKPSVIVTAPPPVPPAIKVEPPKPPLPAQAALETVDPCVRDEQRLVRLRSNPTPDEIANFQHQLGCPRLRAQVQRLFESYVAEPRSTAPVATAPTAAAPANAGPKPPPQAQAQAAPAEDPCVRDVVRLAQLRAEPSADAIARFERERLRTDPPAAQAAARKPRSLTEPRSDRPVPIVAPSPLVGICGSM